MTMKVFSFSKFLAFFLSLTLAFSTFLVEPKIVQSDETTFAVIGNISANGKAQMKLITGEWLNIGSTFLPVFNGSFVKTEEGTAVYTYSDNGLIEILHNSELNIHVDQTEGILDFVKGTIRFTTPSNTSLFIKTPLATIVSRRLDYASKNEMVPAHNGETVGIIDMKEDGTVSIISLKGDLSVTTNDNNTQLVRTGEGIKVAKLMDGMGHRGTGAGPDYQGISIAVAIGGAAVTGIVIAVATAFGDNNGTASPGGGGFE